MGRKRWPSIRLAEDLLQGNSPLGQDVRHLEGLSTAEREKLKLQTPEFRATGTGGRTRAIEIKALADKGGETVGKDSIKRNVGKAMSQIRTIHSETGETGGLIRIDGRDAGPIAKTPDEIRNDINGELLASKPDPKGIMRKGVDYIQWVEVFYKNAAGQPVHLVFEVQGGKLVP